LKHRFLLQTALACALLLGIAAYAGRILRLSDSWAIGQADIAQLHPETEQYLAGLDHSLSITYFATDAERMPTHLKEVERQVRRLLKSFKRSAPGQIDYRVIDPEASGATGIAYAARHKASSFSVRRVLHDEQSEQKIWSSLVLASAGQPEILIQSIQQDHLRHLEGLVVEHLKAQRQPPRPVFAVAANGPYRLLPALLNERGDVIELDLDRESEIPLDADVLFWMQPSVVTPEHVRSLRRFVESGRSVVLAGSAYSVGYALEAEKTLYIARRFDSAWEDLLQPFGLNPVPDLLLDTNMGTVHIEVGGQVHEVEAPFHLRMLPAFYHMKGFLLPARGGLNLVAASALEIDVARAAASGFVAEQFGTTTEKVRVLPLPDSAFSNEDLLAGLPVPKQNLFVRLNPQNAWHGEVLVLASAAPFQDGIINQPGYAHRVFLNNIARTYGAPERLVRARIDKTPPPRLDLPSGIARLFWRFFTVALLPLVALVIGAHRYRLWDRQIRRSMPLKRWTWPALCMVVLALGTWILQGPNRFYLDWTQEQLNTPTPTSERLLRESAADLEAELYITARASMPSALKRVEARVLDLLSHDETTLQVLRPENMLAADIGRLRNEDITPFAIERVLHDTLATQSIWSALSLRRGAQQVIVPRLDVQGLNHLEFLLAAALEQLATGRKPRVAIVSDLPRLSPAEALEDYHKKGLIPPSGVDIYSALKELLANHLYDVQHINPKNPVMPPDIDVLLWLQPRRDSGQAILLLSEYLARGGRAIVALQHFNIQQRQYRGSGFQTVYWPQPQFQDFDRFSALYGITQQREVLFDRTQSHLALETQVNRTAVREYDAQKVALPFLIRAVAAHHARDSALTRHLGDLLFIWGNRFSLDVDKLRAMNIRAQVAVTTSDRSWSYPWRGGWLPPEVFHSEDYLPERQPLVVLLEGRFDRAAFSAGEGGRGELALVEEAEADGQLLLIGSSEMFKNEHLYAAEFQHDQFLLNAVAQMAYGQELAELQARRPVSRGFVSQSTEAKSFWRVFSVGLAPLLFAVYGVWRLRRQRRKS
jgi:hypothetical protein